VPTCKTGRTFVKELSTWLEHFNVGSVYRSIAVKTFIILPALLLQKPSAKSKRSEHVSLLKKRLLLWQNRDIDELMKEAKTIQRQLSKSSRKKTEDCARTFSRFMFEGKVNAAIRLLCDNENKGVLTLSDEILKVLQSKHPQPAEIEEDTLLHGPIEDVHESFFSKIDESMIFRAAKFTKGAAGPSQADAQFFKFILTHKNFKEEGRRLREQTAQFARLITTRPYSAEVLDSYNNCRLIPLNKFPGVRPIGIGESFRRIIGKAISWVLKKEIQQTAGPLQTCTGIRSGAEAAVHYMREQYKLESSEAVILVDATNAFNSVNRAVLLHNIRVLCPEFSTIAINMYRAESRLFVCGKEIASREGTQQGDNLAMALFAMGTLPILRRLTRTKSVAQIWLADDATATGDLISLLSWWRDIIKEGKKYGYYINESKSCLILKNAHQNEIAEQLFGDTKITIKEDGHRHLGAVLGTEKFRESYINNLVEEWASMLKKLASFAKTQPHAAYSSFTHGVRHKFTYFMRTMDISTYMAPLDKIITDEFIPSLFGCLISPLERKLISLPLKYGGLGIPILTDLAVKEYSTSILVTQPLIKEMESAQAGYEDHTANSDALRAEQLRIVLQERVVEYKQRHNDIVGELDDQTARLVEQMSEPGSYNWLSCLPIKKYGFSMNKSEFRDSIRLRYGKSLERLPSQCACGAKFEVNHALNCHRGGYIIIRHNAVRDYLAEMIDIVCSDVEKEPKLQALGGEEFSRATLTGEQAHPDIRARGYYRAGQQAFFDVKVMNPNSESYLNISTEKVYERAEQQKKSAYNERILQVEHGSFTPLIFSVSGGMGTQAKTFAKMLCNKIAYKKRQEYSDVMNMFRCKLSFLIQKMVLLCIRGSRSLNNKNNNIELSSNIDDFEYGCFESRLS
jgi:hypothetical protein